MFTLVPSGLPARSSSASTQVGSRISNMSIALKWVPLRTFAFAIGFTVSAYDWIRHAWSVYFPSDVLKARHPNTDKGGFLVIPSRGRWTRRGSRTFLWQYGPQLSELRSIGRILLKRYFSTGEAVYVVARMRPFDLSEVTQLAKLGDSGFIRTLPPAAWLSPEFSPGRSLDSVGMILFNDPAKDGLAQAVEATGFRLEYKSPSTEPNIRTRFPACRWVEAGHPRARGDFPALITL